MYKERQNYKQRILTVCLNYLNAGHLERRERDSNKAESERLERCVNEQGREKLRVVVLSVVIEGERGLYRDAES